MQYSETLLFRIFLIKNKVLFLDSLSINFFKKKWKKIIEEMKH